MQDKHTIGVVIVNWNNYKDTKEALVSVQEQTYSNLKIVVVDGNSSDGSTSTLKKEFPGNEYIFLKQDKGYAYSANAGISYLLEENIDYIVLMNNDVVLDASCIEVLKTSMSKQTKRCVLGPRIFSYYDKDKYQVSGSSVNLVRARPVSHWAKVEGSPRRVLEPYVVKKLPGSCFLVSREVVEEVGRMDESFFLYYSDTDWQKRFNDKGVAQKVVPSAKAYHKVSATTKEVENKIFYYDTRDLLNYVSKHYSFLVLFYVFVRQYFDKFLGLVFSNNPTNKLKYLNLAYRHFLKRKRGKVL